MPRAARNDLPAEYVRSILDYDPETGALQWKAPRRGRREAGWLEKNGQRRLGIDGHTYTAQRIIWLIATGAWPPVDVDHHDLDKSNNRWLNLRLATSSENNANRRLFSSNSSGYKGVSYHAQTNKWWARIMKNRVSISLGLFGTPEAAAAAYDAACSQLNGEFARHNYQRP